MKAGSNQPSILAGAGKTRAVGTPVAVHAALLTVQVLFGTWPVAGAAALRQLSPPALIGFRTLLAAPVFFLFARASGAQRPNARDLGLLFVLAFLGVAGNQLLFAEGLMRAGPVNAAVLSVVIPPMTLLVSTLFGLEKPSRSRLFGCGIAIAGALVILQPERLDLSDQHLVGNLLLFSNATLYAAYLALARPVIARVGTLGAIAWIFVFGALEALPLTGPAIASAPWGSLTHGVLLSLVFILFGATLGTYGLNAYALGRADSSLVALYVLVQPPVGALAAWLFLGQSMTHRTLVSAVIIAAGVAVASGILERRRI